VGLIELEPDSVSRSRGAVVALANRAPKLADLWRYSTALAAAWLPTRASYSQHGEDVWLLEQVRDLSRDRFRYVDVGANHPSRLSNTYLLYRHGFSGVVVEPNESLLALHRRFRPRDIAVRSACGERARLGRFVVRTIAGTSSLSAAAAPDISSRVRRQDYVPVLPLDAIVEAAVPGPIAALSIDTEGSDTEVLRSASEALDRSLFVIVEANTEEEADSIKSILSSSFELVRQVGPNLIWRNRHFDAS
jgi:FkbM family methyltransferase